MKFGIISTVSLGIMILTLVDNVLCKDLDDGSKALGRESLVDQAIKTDKEKLSEYCIESNQSEIAKLNCDNNLTEIELRSEGSNPIIVTKECNAGNITCFSIKYGNITIEYKHATLSLKSPSGSPLYDAVVNASNNKLEMNNNCEIMKLINNNLDKKSNNKKTKGSKRLNFKDKTSILTKQYFSNRNKHSETPDKSLKKTKNTISTNEYCRTWGYEIANLFIIHVLAPSDCKAPIANEKEIEESKIKLNEAYESILKGAFDIYMKTLKYNHFMFH